MVFLDGVIFCVRNPSLGRLTPLYFSDILNRGDAKNFLESLPLMYEDINIPGQKLLWWLPGLRNQKIKLSLRFR